MFKIFSFFRSSQEKPSTSKKRGRGLHFEPLEQRRLLAADLAAISGVVFADGNANGIRDGAEAGISGIGISLSGTDSQGAVSRSAVTDAQGVYRFDQLRAGTYDVTQQPPPPAGVLPSGAGQTTSITISAAQAAGIDGPAIDTFQGVAQQLTAVAPGNSPVSSSVVDVTAIGGTRDMWADITSPAGMLTLTANAPFLPGVLDMNPGSTSIGHYVLTWDGDTDPETLDATGLKSTGVDLTVGGTMIGLQFQIGVDKPNEQMQIRIYSDANNWSESIIQLPDTGGALGGDAEAIWATDFTIGAGSGADFTDVGAIQIEIESNAPAMDGQIDVIGTFGPSVIEADFANTVAAPSISIEKSTNGVDADTGQGPFVGFGTTVVFDYVVTNPGNTALAAVAVVDDNGTPGDSSDDFSPTLIRGDDNSDGLLNRTETWRYRATAPAALGQYGNNSVVTANPVSDKGADLAGVNDVTDADPSHHFGVSATIDIEKSTNGFDADTGQGPVVAAGSTVVFDYVVTNSGNVAIGSVKVGDDHGTPSDASDDLMPVFVSGDTDNDGLLDTDESWRFQATAPAATGQYGNISTVVGNPVTATGDDIALLEDVRAADPSHHFGVSAAIHIEKSTNGFDADTGTGPLIAVGGSAEFEYVVTNTGNAALSNVKVTDDGNATITFVSGDADNDGRLDLNETWIYRATASVTAGQHACTAVVTAIPVDPSGAPVIGGRQVTDDDPSHHFGVTAAIDIEKSTNGQDADTGRGPLVRVGDAVTLTYVVQNTGNVALGDVVVTDGTGGSPVLVSGDDNGDGRLDVGESWTYRASVTAVAGQHECTAVVTANPVDGAGQDIATVSDVTDNDPSHHFGVVAGIQLQKATNGQDADVAPGPSIPFGGQVTFTFEVSNPGNQPLTNVKVVDDNGTPSDTSDDVQPTFVSGDDDGDGLLDPEETWLYELLAQAIAGQYQNRAVVTADDIFGEILTDEDLSHYVGEKPIVPQAIPPTTMNKRRLLSSRW